MKPMDPVTGSQTFPFVPPEVLCGMHRSILAMLREVSSDLLSSLFRWRPLG
jgi:hypothetical protein